MFLVIKLDGTVIYMHKSVPLHIFSFEYSKKFQNCETFNHNYVKYICVIKFIETN